MELNLIDLSNFIIYCPKFELPADNLSYNPLIAITVI